jgi:hypothetical protein
LLNILKNEFVEMPEIYTIANSPITINMGNEIADYLICIRDVLDQKEFEKNTKKIVLIIDPLVVESEEDLNKEVEYIYSPLNLEFNQEPIGVIRNEHVIKGTVDSVINQLNEISNKYNINDFIVVTNQKNLTNIFKVIERMT